MKREKEAFLEALAGLHAEALSACPGWTAHDVLAHVVAGGTEIVELVQARIDGQRVPATRGFEEREQPFRELPDPELRRILENTEVLENTLRTAFDQHPQATIPFTEMDLTPIELLVHARSELAIHRWDLTGHDEVGTELMQDPGLTSHAVKVLDGMKVLNEWINHRAQRAGINNDDDFEVVLRIPEGDDVMISYNNGHASLNMAEGQGTGPCIESNSADRLLMLWGRRPRSARSYLDATDLRRCGALLFA
jgi:hypothetical protein